MTTFNRLRARPADGRGPSAPPALSGARRAAAGFLALALALPATAEAPPTCPTDVDAPDPHRLLRAISLDLRGVIPTPDEYALIDADGQIPEAVIDQWLDDPAFEDRVVRQHRDLLWNNVSQVRYTTVPARFRSTSGILWRNNTPAITYRGGDVYCGNFAASDADGDGRWDVRLDAQGRRQEGWVLRHPYWDADPNAKVKVCAFDAQEALVSTLGTACDDRGSYTDPGCGCGPELRWCATNETDRAIGDSFSTDVERRLAYLLAEDRPYTDLLTERTAWVNGPIAFYLRHQSKLYSDLDLSEVPVLEEQLPTNLKFTDKDTWVAIDLGPEASGILTSPAWLLRFQTNRSRANRFWNAFLCTPFEAPPGGIDLSAPPILNLTEREGCKYCHSLLEPAAAHWGRWTEAGAGYLHPAGFPAFDERCAECAESAEGCSPDCRKHYIVDPLTSEEDPFVGWLTSYEFLDPDYAAHVEGGPKRLVAETLADGRLPGCVSRNTADWLMGRSLTVDDEQWVDELAWDFSRGQYDYKALVKAIVLSENYQRVH